MLTIQRLNMDNTWRIEWDGKRLLIDPWLIGTEIDGGRWFNEQWHATPPVPIHALPSYDAIVVTQSYNDHCHLETLTHLRSAIPIFASPKPFRKIRKALPDRSCHEITDYIHSRPISLGSLQLQTLAPDRRLDPIYYALVLTLGQEAVVLAPHGFYFNPEQLDFLGKFHIRLLGTTFSIVQLPALLGGKVNPGLENARTLVEQLTPDYIINTHDEQKHARGIVMRIARTEYPDLSMIEFPGTSKFIPTPHYDQVTLK